MFAKADPLMTHSLFEIEDTYASVFAQAVAAGLAGKIMQAFGGRGRGLEKLIAHVAAAAGPIVIRPASLLPELTTPLFRTPHASLAMTGMPEIARG